MAYTRADDFFYMGSIEFRASKVILTRFKINRYELHMLCSLAAYLQLHEKKAVGRKVLTDWLGLSYAMEKKGWGYIGGLIAKGAIHQMAWRTKNVGNGNSLAISTYGGKILEAYWNEIHRLEQLDKARKSLPGYQDIIVSEPLPGYTIRQLGRDS